MAPNRDVVFIDSSVLISCGRRGGARFQALAREARQRDTVFRISPQEYAEVTGDPAQVTVIQISTHGNSDEQSQVTD